MEFFVIAINEHGNIIGRNGSQDIPVGTVFTTIRHGTIDLQSHIVLHRVRWYEFYKDEIPGGHAAELTVSGDGLEMLKELLKDLPDNQYLSLIADVKQ